MLRDLTVQVSKARFSHCLIYNLSNDILNPVTGETTSQGAQCILNYFNSFCKEGNLTFFCCCRKGLANEVTVTWEGGNMWPFTCLGFEKEMPSLPGKFYVNISSSQYIKGNCEKFLHISAS